MTAQNAMSGALRGGTLASVLARVQARFLGATLARLTGTRLPNEIVIGTHGDRDATTPLPTLGGRGVFTEAVGCARRVHRAQHSIEQARHCDYEVQLQEANRLVSDEVGVDRWTLAYQSRSGPPQVPWLGPDIAERLGQLATLGVRCRSPSHRIRVGSYGSDVRSRPRSARAGDETRAARPSCGERGNAPSVHRWFACADP